MIKQIASVIILDPALATLEFIIIEMESEPADQKQRIQ